VLLRVVVPHVVAGHVTHANSMKQKKYNLVEEHNIAQKY